MTELQDLGRMVETYRQRVAECERMNADLEQRLESQGRQRMALEGELTERVRAHKKEMEAKQQELNAWQQRYETLQHQCHKVRDNLQRTERELMSVLSKKYELVEAAKREARKQILEEEAIKRDVSRLIARTNPEEPTAAAAAGGDVQMQKAKPDLARPQRPPTGSPSEIRCRMAMDTLNDFLGN